MRRTTYPSLIGAILVAVMAMSACSETAGSNAGPSPAAIPGSSAAAPVSPSNSAGTTPTTATGHRVPRLNLAVAPLDVIKGGVLAYLEHTQAGLRFDNEWRDPGDPTDSDFMGALKRTAAAQRFVLAIEDYAPAKYAPPGHPGDCLGEHHCGIANTSAAAQAYAAQAVRTIEACRQLNANCASELWNEPNIAQFWGPKADPKAYAKAVNAAAAAVKRTDQTALVITGGLSPYPNVEKGDYTPAGFVQAAIEAGLKPNNLDGIGLHLYGNDGSAQNELVEVLKAAARQDPSWGNLKIWLTEFGWSPGSDPGSPDGYVEQAAMKNFMNQWFASPQGGPTFYYTYKDDPDGRERYGLLTATSHHKALSATFLDLAA